MNQRRWLVRREPTRHPRFGETARDVLAWTVRPYYWVDGVRVWMGPRIVIGQREAAVKYARGACAIHYYSRGRGSRADHARRNQFDRALAERR